MPQIPGGPSFSHSSSESFFKSILSSLDIRLHREMIVILYDRVMLDDPRLSLNDTWRTFSDSAGEGAKEARQELRAR